MKSAYLENRRIDIWGHEMSIWIFYFVSTQSHQKEVEREKEKLKTSLCMKQEKVAVRLRTILLWKTKYADI